MSEKTKDKKTKISVKGSRTIIDVLEEELQQAEMTEQERAEHMAVLSKISQGNTNIMFVGATGSGKSSTINALFNMEVAKVGVGVDTETNTITKYELDHLILWDTPGLGEGKKADKDYKNMLMKKLVEIDDDGAPVIDLVLVILDASTKDLGTTYSLINEVIIPCLGQDEAERRVLLAINQIDVAMKGRHWNMEENKPDAVLNDFVLEKARSVRARISETTGVDIKPVCYCAGYTEDDGTRCDPYNLTKLLYYIVSRIPAKKRLTLIGNINPCEDKWLFDDSEKDYKGDLVRTCFEVFKDEILRHAFLCSEAGRILLGIPGQVIGGLAGGFFGIFTGLLETGKTVFK